MFIDEITVFAHAGHGGKGCVALHREAYVAKGGPSGGNGGRGGDVILEADHDLNNLIAQYYQPRLIAQGGEPGMGKGMDGHAGKDLVVKVPCGTLVWRLDSSSSDSEDEPDPSTPPAAKPKVIPLGTRDRPLIRHTSSPRAIEIDLSSEPEPAPKQPPSGKRVLVTDLTEHGQRFTLCKGGRGGLGNRNFATARRQTPRFAQPGEPGQEGSYLFELRLIAEVGVVGYPNAGKSTLLAAISAARPKIAPYPFTTLHPQVGILQYPDWRRLTICDVPGLIAGAHRNVGLGHAFLRHIERCKILVILLDMAGTDGRNAWDDYHQLLRELELYDPGLLEKLRMVVANKMDEPAAQMNLKSFKRRVKRVPVLPISAAFDQGINELKQAMRARVDELATNACSKPVS